MKNNDYFNNVAGHWDTMRAGFFSEALREKALTHAEVRPGGKAADIGAGTGFLTEGLLARNLLVIAIDQSREMLAVLNNKFGASEELECRVGESEQLPVNSDEVDYVFANMYLHHVENPGKTIAEMARILKPGGTLVITDLDRHESAFLLTEHHDRWPGFDRADVARWLTAAQLVDINVDSASEECCATSKCGCDNASISIFMASGKKR